MRTTYQQPKLQSQGLALGTQKPVMVPAGRGGGQRITSVPGTGSQAWLVLILLSSASPLAPRALPFLALVTHTGPGK